MSNDTRKSQPISRHPLFPALVALWFGALFGLGSLAVRVSLLESLVINSHIDVIVPQAAPPLGMTARILLAAALAVIGGALGGWIARWIARPRVEARERRRGAQPAPAVKPANAGQQEEIPAPAVEADIEEEDYAPVAPAPAGRRRALAVQELPSQPEYMRDAAPLPGSQPQILDVTEFDFAQANAGPSQMSHEPAELDLGVFPSEDVLDAAPQATTADAWQAEPRADDALAMPAERGFEERQAQAAPADAAGLRNSVSELAIEAGPDFDSAPVSQAGPAGVDPARAPDLAAPPFAAHGTEPAEPAMQADMPDAVPEAMSQAIEAPSDFARPFAALVESPAVPQPFAVPMGANDASPVAALSPQGMAEAPADMPEPMAHANDEAIASMQPQPLLAQPESEPVSRIATADLGELSPVELIERMALSLQRRRARLAAAESVTAPGASTAALAAMLAAAPSPEAAQPVAPHPPIAEPALPAAETAAPDTPGGLALPAALRPIDFAEYEEEEEDGPIPVPPRTIAMPVAVTAAVAPPAFAAPFAAPFSLPYPTEESPDDEMVAENAADTGEQDVPEGSYSSLLDIGRPIEQRQTFVRIEEPDADPDSIEPVVIFPGQSARAESRFETPEHASPEPQPAASPAAPAGSQPQLRGFDAPGADQDPGLGVPARDPAETERALRSALATLQRMSGAA